MDKEILTQDELRAIDEATAEYGAATNYWLLKIHLCFIIGLTLMVFVGFYPDQVISWLKLTEAPHISTFYELLELRAMTITTLIISGYLCYRYLPNIKVAIGTILSIVVVNLFMDIPVYYSAKLAVGDWDLSIIFGARIVLIYSLASLYLTAEYLPCPPRKLFANPFRKSGYSREVQ
ncbi:MAG: hypothetical protein ISQ56_09050 [Pseudomonadales bacterium]|nr:hypothetical protein [Pseudomonadales bacterium]